MSKLKAPIALVILDGWGLGDEKDGYNAIVRSEPPHMKLLSELYPTTTLTCSGEAVGLPEGQMGNSEVGHLNIGAGRVVYQELTRITKEIREGFFFTNPILVKAVEEAIVNDSALHLMGLLSDGGVHSHNDHLYALLELAKRYNLKKVYIHAFLDGRDVPPSSGIEYIKALEEKIREIGVGRIATVAGRYYAMDRDKRWERIEKAYNAMVCREGVHTTSAIDAVAESYKEGKTDEFVLPSVIDGCGDCGVKAKDSVIFFNFRPDRAREITRVFVDENFDGFARCGGRLPLYFACMTQYDETLEASIAYKPQFLKNTLGQVLENVGLTQLRIAETEKYAHVTFFFNGGEEKPYQGEERILVPSPKVATYDLQPEMSAFEVTDKLIDAIKSGKFDVIILNFANTDMVGHTGKLDAAMKAVSAVDVCVGRIVETMRSQGGITLITADHGNAEKMLDHVTCEPFTAHTTNEVPLILVSEKHRGAALHKGSLADIAPTILTLAGVEIPAEMTGKSLIK
ncbi:phosphoglycerate mutase [Pelosinus fermentans]|uniref:2,3-bisphosphoglycerate-independent phosphoglycerate mutase n=1 Tax=Pelosinus TaxID=365348 RepID=UPI0002684F58|nr:MULTISPECIES: 2,3-bisphosphoglycerate-independent phosphoglycerate mutase [Pelosinus]OAM92997.1 2,3-bisphosphoglycerate-independent phosphoglycerate mutase [Pelosinus fermentans DSM 17108]SDQ63563.1 phosphoglycerate mutase [Pelosinus fermentans]